jgi:hypothetical protein
VLTSSNRHALAERLASIDIRDYVSLAELACDLLRINFGILPARSGPTKGLKTFHYGRRRLLCRDESFQTFRASTEQNRSRMQFDSDFMIVHAPVASRILNRETPPKNLTTGFGFSPRDLPSGYSLPGGTGRQAHPSSGRVVGKSRVRVMGAGRSTNLSGKILSRSLHGLFVEISMDSIQLTDALRRFRVRQARAAHSAENFEEAKPLLLRYPFLRNKSKAGRSFASFPVVKIHGGDREA